MILKIFWIGQNGRQKDRLILSQALRSFAKIMFGCGFHAIDIVTKFNRV